MRRFCAVKRIGIYTEVWGCWRSCVGLIRRWERRNRRDGFLTDDAVSRSARVEPVRRLGRDGRLRGQSGMLDMAVVRRERKCRKRIVVIAWVRGKPGRALPESIDVLGGEGSTRRLFLFAVLDRWPRVILYVDGQVALDEQEGGNEREKSSGA